MEKMEKMEKNGLTVIDFFCGAGIGAVGIEYAGFETLFAFDNNKHAVDTYNANFKHKAIRLDAKTIDFEQIPSADVFVGGFPCQPFSSSGKNLGELDPNKGSLGEIMFDAIKHKKPKAFLIENVSGITNKKHKNYFDKLLSITKDLYNITWELSNCSEYGVPQNRKRVFIIGIRKDLNASFKMPEKSNHLYTVRDAISDLSTIPDNINNHDNKDSFKLRKDEIPFANKVPVGGNWRDLCVEDQKTFLKTAFYSGGGRTGFLRKVKLDEPARTILSSPMGKNTAQILDWGNGEDSRRFTVRESLRLQSVPDEFFFPESVPTSKQYERCSGIPSLMSYKLMIQIKKTILNN